jgi:general secretion pathway protein M
VNWFQLNQRASWIIGLTLVIPVLLFLNGLFGLLGVREEYQAEIERMEPRLARLQGLLEYENQLRDSAGKVDRQVVNLVYPVSADRATVSATLQKDVRQILIEAGLSVTNSQVMPVREKEEFDFIGLKLTVKGGVASLDAALIAIAGYKPQLLVESLDVWPTRASRVKDEQKAQVISASLQVLALRAVQ